MRALCCILALAVLAIAMCLKARLDRLTQSSKLDPSAIYKLGPPQGAL